MGVVRSCLQFLLLRLARPSLLIFPTVGLLQLVNLENLVPYVAQRLFAIRLDDVEDENALVVLSDIKNHADEALLQHV